MAVQDIPVGAELHTGADCIPGEEELRTEADSKPAVGKLGCREVVAGGSCCKDCSRRGGGCRAGRGEASWAELGRAAVPGLRRTG